MRISDWSSDVCSSDLIPLPGRDATSPLPPPTPMTTPLLEQLIEAFRVLPGVGPKTAQRMAYHVLERERDGGRRLADALAESIDRLGHCARRRPFTEHATRATRTTPPPPPTPTPP